MAHKIAVFFHGLKIGRWCVNRCSENQRGKTLPCPFAIKNVIYIAAVKYIVYLCSAPAHPTKKQPFLAESSSKKQRHHTLNRVVAAESAINYLFHP